MSQTQVYVTSEKITFEEIDIYLDKEISLEILICCGIVSFLIFIANNSSLIFLIIKKASRTFLDYLMLLG